MSSADRLQICPTRGALVALKSRTSAATRGHDLLKRKSDALQIRVRQILPNLISTKLLVGEAFKEAAFSLAEMRFVTGDVISLLILETVGEKARAKVYTRVENIVGVKITVYQCYEEGTDTYEYTGLSRGGQRLSIVKTIFSNLLNRIADLATLQTTFLTLDKVLKITKIRVSAIEHVVLPKLLNTTVYVMSELEEFDREDFYRIKKLKEKKKAKTNEPEEIVKPSATRLKNTKCACHQ